MDAKGIIITSGDQLIVSRIDGKRRVFLAQVDCSGGSDAHLDAVRRTAKRYFGAGTLRRTDSLEVPRLGYAERWGWTRENRGEGQASILVDHYTVH